jgi:tripeptide aminopeptidase
MAVLLMWAAGLCAQGFAQSYATKFSLEIARKPAVAAALAEIDRGRERQLAEWIRITETPAPSRMEQDRAAYVKAEFASAGLSAVQVDEAGNVTGLRQGSEPGPGLVFAAHMDTVFPAGTAVKVTRDGGILRAPGVFDNSASVANLLAALRAMRSAGWKTRRDVIFLATVQEEIGLNGMRYWLERNRARTGMLVALDGGFPDVSYGALGIQWLKFIYTSDGSHTLTSLGKPNPARAIARAIESVYRIPLPPPGGDVFAVLNVGMLGGGKIFNAISQESFFTVDFRTNDPVLQKKVRSQIVAAAEAAAREEKTGFRMETANDSAAGGTAAQLAGRRAHPLVQTAVDILEYLDVGRGKPVRAQPTGSTDGNIGVEMKIPTVAVGRGFGGGQHTLGEYAEIESVFLGAKQILLLAACLAEVE